MKIGPSSKMQILAAFLETMIVSVVLSLSPASCSVGDANTQVYSRHGDVLIGGLFPLHDYDENLAQCGSLLNMSALRMVEAMAFAVDKINRDESILPNVTVGFEIYDTCLDEMTTLEQSLALVPAQRSFLCLNRGSPVSTQEHLYGKVFDSLPVCRTYMAAAVGARRSTSSVQAASLLGIYRLPQISYLSTCDDLSNKHKYPFFMRTVPPDKYQIRAMASLLMYFNWTFASVVYSDELYGTGGASSFFSLAEDIGICITTLFRLSQSSSEADYDDVIKGLLSYSPEAKVVVLFAHSDEVNSLLAASVRANVVGEFIWIGSDSWGSDGLERLQGNEGAAFGSILFKPYSAQVPEFDDYFSSIVPSKSDNPWMYEFMEEYTDCSKYPNLTGKESCDAPGLLSHTNTDDHVALVIDAVYAVALATHVIQERYCPEEEPLCEAITPPIGDVLMGTLFQLNFTGSSGTVSFDENGDPPGAYVISNVQMTDDGEFVMVPVGRWEQNGENLGDLVMFGQINWFNGTSQWSYNTTAESGSVPSSTCSQPCKADEITMRSTEWQCCWLCQRCQQREIMVKNDTECQPCGGFTWPHHDLHHCEEIPPDYLKWSNPWAITFAIIASIGLLAALTTVGVYIANNDNRLIKASSRELCYILLIGIIFLYISAFYHLAKPSDVICYFRRWTSVSLCMIYAPLATKTNRIYRIFADGKKSAKRPRFVSSQAQVTIAATLISIQVIITTALIVVYPPEAILVMADPTKAYVDLMCRPSLEAKMSSLSYIIALLCASAWQAFKTRKLPANYNESRFITFSVFSALMIVVAVVPASFLSISSKYKMVYSVMGLLLNGSIILASIFFPKIFAIYFVEEDDLNVQGHSPHQSKACRVPGDTHGQISHIPVTTLPTSKGTENDETKSKRTSAVFKLFGFFPKTKVSDSTVHLREEDSTHEDRETEKSYSLHRQNSVTCLEKRSRDIESEI
ncbi:metabotropic glutamate receptor 3-like [Ptychodera flava]|uniref:metabotropic glutamate receptor 3-like n=1 Tax=Ptychodera flava TaxID=63121 RepID=UPI00396A3EED